MAAYAPSFRAGAYKITYDSVMLGYTEVGFEMITRPSANILRIDPLGRTPVEGLWTGIEDIIIRAEIMEFSIAGWAKATNFIHHATNSAEGTPFAAGTLVSSASHVKTLVLAPAVTPGSGGNQTYTFTKAYPLEPVRTIFSAQTNRRTPVGFYIFSQQVADDTAFKPEMYTVSTP